MGLHFRNMPPMGPKRKIVDGTKGAIRKHKSCQVILLIDMLVHAFSGASPIRSLKRCLTRFRVFVSWGSFGSTPKPEEISTRDSGFPPRRPRLPLAEDVREACSIWSFPSLVTARIGGPRMPGSPARASIASLGFCSNQRCLGAFHFGSPTRASSFLSSWLQPVWSWISL